MKITTTSGRVLAILTVTVLFNVACVFRVSIRNVHSPPLPWQEHFVPDLQIESNLRVRKTYNDDSLTEGGDNKLARNQQAVAGGKQTKGESATPRVDGEHTQDLVGQHLVAGLSCDRYGGPADASEMVYWSDIPSDSEFVSPYKKVGPERKYLTFEPDEGGWNNIRMSMETAVALAHAMGRTLVMPPAQKMYLLQKGGKQQKKHFGFGDFFHFDSLGAEHDGLEIISMEEFVEIEIMTGNIRDKTGDISFPPENRTDWSMINKDQAEQLRDWLRNDIAEAPIWNFDECIAVFPEKPGPGSAARVLEMADKILDNEDMDAAERIASFKGKPTAVDAPAIDRMREMLAYRTDLCIYDETLQEAPVVHFMGDEESGARLLVHFYAYLFFEDWKQDLWTKRFVRDHLRYVDEIQCAAARVVNAIREKSKENGDKRGTYTSFHIRRGDFQYDETRLEASQIYKNVENVLRKSGTVFIATDERDKKFFDPFREHYHVYFLDDFKHLLDGINTNYYGMLDQLIASRGRTFVGAYLSTFTGYINRMRGYHSQKEKLEGYEEGKIKSYYYAPKKKKYVMRKYYPLEEEQWSREFPIAWRDIDKGVEDLALAQ